MARREPDLCIQYSPRSAICVEKIWLFLVAGKPLTRFRSFRNSIECNGKIRRLVCRIEFVAH